LSENCCQYFVVEHNGDIYPCDFFVRKNCKLGNITKTSWRRVISSSVYQSFGSQKSNWNKFCKTCDFLTLCSGDCLKHRMHGNHPARNLSRLCSGWKQFFNHSAHKFNELAQKIRVERLNSINHNRTQRNNPVSNVMPVGRNQTCPCGSGKKFKKCCGYRP
jgi:uncharacterized protein